MKKNDCTTVLPEPPEGESRRPEEGESVADGDGLGDEDIGPILCGGSEDRIEELLGVLFSQGELLEELHLRMEGMETSIQQTGEELKKLAGDHTALVSAHEQINRLSELYWDQRIVEPMASQLFPIVDFVVEFRLASRRKAAESGSVDSAFGAIQTMLLDFLGTYGIESYTAEVGSELDPSAMKVMRAVATEDRALHNHVRACVRLGFKKGRTVLRPVGIVLWRYEAPVRPQNHST